MKKFWRSRPHRIGLGAIGIAGLALLVAAYGLTYEPAPRIRVRWREGIGAEQRVTLERRYLLVNGRDPMSQGSIAYDLLDTSTSNLKALVEDPAVADTNDIERHTYEVPFQVDYGDEWMWMAHRVPGLRDGRVRAVLIATFAAMAIVGLATRESRSRIAAWRRLSKTHARRVINWLLEA